MPAAAVPASTRIGISARLKRVQTHGSAVSDRVACGGSAFDVGGQQLFVTVSVDKATMGIATIDLATGNMSSVAVEGASAVDVMVRACAPELLPRARPSALSLTLTAVEESRARMVPLAERATRPVGTLQASRCNPILDLPG